MSYSFMHSVCSLKIINDTQLAIYSKHKKLILYLNFNLIQQCFMWLLKYKYPSHKDIIQDDGLKQGVCQGKIDFFSCFIYPFNVLLFYHKKK